MKRITLLFAAVLFALPLCAQTANQTGDDLTVIFMYFDQQKINQFAPGMNIPEFVQVFVNDRDTEAEAFQITVDFTDPLGRQGSRGWLCERNMKDPANASNCIMPLQARRINSVLVVPLRPVPGVSKLITNGN